MAPKITWARALVLIIIIGGCTFYIAWQYQANSLSNTYNHDVLFQLAAFNTFSTGQYAGTMNFSELEKYGNFGIGTFDGFDGEMIALDGVFYQISASGIPQVANASQTTPYATITFFEAEQTFTVSGLNYTDLKSFLDEHLTSKGVIYAIKVNGTFDTAQVRSPEKQTPPYPNINDALKTQHLFNLTSVSATAVGFWFPTSMDGVDYSGYHLHLITDDHNSGGHLLECSISNATIQIQQINEYNLVLP
jgi:acetolactate decarboxylase